MDLLLHVIHNQLINMIDSFQKFLLTKETTLFGKIRNIFAGYTIVLLWVSLITVLLEVVFTTNQCAYRYSSPFIVEVFLVVILAPLWEELVFRALPLTFIKDYPKLLIPVMVFTSIIFGLLHGEPINILIQGVMGFVMASVYIKNGYSYWSSVAIHALWNGSIVFGILG